MKTNFTSTITPRPLSAKGGWGLIYTALGTIFSVSVMFSQSQNWWRTNGNTPQSTDYLGTSNNSPLIIKTNNIERLRIAPNGFVGIANSNPQYVLDVGGRAKLRYNVYCDSLLQCSYLKVNNLSGSGNALVVTDAQGNINRLNYSGNNNDVLTGNGNWTNINALLPSPIWQSSGQNIFYNNGYVGIGTSNPLFSLDVVGDIRVSNNIYVGGGIVISDKVNAFTEVTAPKVVASEAKSTRLVTDSILMDTTRAIYGSTIVRGDVKLENKLTIQGNARFNGMLTATQGVMFNDSVGFKLVSSSSNNPVLVFGKTIGTPPTPVNFCTNPFPLTSQLPPNFQMWGLFQILWNNTSLALWADGANSIIDHQGNGSLLLNYNCGKDVVVGNANSGNLIVNNKIGIGTSNPGCKVDIDAINTNGLCVNTNHNYDWGFGILSKINRANTKAISVILDDGVNPASEKLVVYGDGKIGVGTSSPQKQLHISSNNADILVQSTANNPASVWTINNNYGYGFGIDANGNGHIWRDFNNPKDVITISSNGAIGINMNGGGLSASQITNALNNNQLAVNGQILAIEYSAKYPSDWPDYVFDRKNPSLYEIEQYIKQNKRLQGFENALYYKENGIKLTEIIVKQQEKIEEIFLYLIELKKENDLLKKEIEQMKQK
ncbi:MAG: hypothetical protein OHK0036_09320 [Bacteroidia bacterium]